MKLVQQFHSVGDFYVTLKNVLHFGRMTEDSKKFSIKIARNGCLKKKLTFAMKKIESSVIRFSLKNKEVLCFIKIS